MAGPYAAIRFGEGVVLDAKFLWGRSVNSIQPDLTYTDLFETTRWLGTLRLAGEAEHGRVLFRPELAFVYFRETQAAYVDGEGAAVPEQTIGTARLSLGPELAIPIPLPGGAAVEPTLSLHGVWEIGASQLSARLAAGVTYTGRNGLSLSLDGGLGEIFIADARSWNVQASLRVPLN